MTIRTTFSKEAFLHKTNKCDEVTSFETYKNKEVLFTNLRQPSNLVFHESKKIFFRQTVIHGQYYKDFKITVCDMIKKKCSDIENIKGGYAIGLDLTTHEIFLGGYNGIYKYNFETKLPEYFSEKDRSVRDLFIRNNFYYIRYPSNRLYVYRKNQFIKVKEGKNFEIEHFYQSKHKNIYYSNKTGLFLVEAKGKESYSIKNRITVKQITEDIYGTIYFLANDGIYVEINEYWDLKNVYNRTGLYGLAFDKSGHPIIADKSTIFRLPGKVRKPCFNASKRRKNKKSKSFSNDGSMERTKERSNKSSRTKKHFHTY